MYYLVDTERYNGCLRLIPGSHMKRHRLHDALPDAHTDDLRKMENPNSPIYQDIHEAGDVPVKAGDLVVGDSRLLHSAHGNKSDQRRTVITLWYMTEFDLLPAPLRARICNDKRHDEWTAEVRNPIIDLIPNYCGDAKAVEWNRTPGPEFK